MLRRQLFRERRVDAQTARGLPATALKPGNKVTVFGYPNRNKPEEMRAELRQPSWRTPFHAVHGGIVAALSAAEGDSAASAGSARR